MQALIVALLPYAVKFGAEAALIMFKAATSPSATNEDVIKALEFAATKTAQDYLNEAKVSQPIG